MRYSAAMCHSSLCETSEREDGRGGRENLCTSKLRLLKCRPARSPLWPCRRIYAPMMSSDSRVFGEGRRSTPTHTDHHTAVTASNCLSSAQAVLKYCLSLLALKPLLRVISIVSSVRRAFSPPPSSLLLLASVRSHSLSSVSLSFKHVSLFPSSRPFSPVVPVR